jgi:hypothetical protein
MQEAHLSTSKNGVRISEREQIIYLRQKGFRDIENWERLIRELMLRKLEEESDLVMLMLRHFSLSLSTISNQPKKQELMAMKPMLERIQQSKRQIQRRRQNQNLISHDSLLPSRTKLNLTLSSQQIQPEISESE